MDNGHAGVPGPAANNNNISHISDPKPSSDADSMEDTAEFRLMMAYAQRRRPTGDAGLMAQCGPGASSPQTPAETETDVKEKKRKKKRGTKNKLLRLLPCVRSKKEEPEDTRGENGGPAVVCFRSGDDGRKEGEKLEKIADTLTKIADDVPPPTPSDIEADGEEDDVEKLIGLLLREKGDKLHEEVLKNASLSELFRDYIGFQRLMSTFLSKMGFADPDALGPQGSPKTQIALTCEVTSRLSAADTLPMSRLLGFGAKYLQDHYSAWLAQQGGYEGAFHSDDDDDEEVN
ncbi:apoptosis facilitator Bcl-2-like protein 14 [Centroberyx affinis]|uniref:apoptosis facilitator Bcl-2-like protein 14 n=1 Tax=Centroberyx affinis TaxID=166261 RepID=UPI003A5B9710